MPITVGDLLALGKSQRTADIYVGVLRRAEGFLETRGTTLADCGPVDVAALADTFRKSHASRGQLRAALLAAWEVLGRPDGPYRAVRVPPSPKGVCRALEPAEAALLEEAAWARRDRAGLAVLIGLYSALRRAEIARVHSDDVVADVRGRPIWLRVIGKGDKTAEVPIHPHLSQALTRHGLENGYLFPGRFGGPVIPDTIWRWTLEVAADAGLRVPTHVLRHTSLAEANDRSTDLRTVQEFARHSRPETTAIYTRTTRARLAQVVSMIDYGRQLADQEEVSA